MGKFADRVTNIMYDEGPGNIVMETFMYKLSLLYGTILKFRNFLYDHNIKKSQSLPCAVISVGNITVGGTGKTPMTIYLAKQLKKRGLRVAVISRGYGGKAEKAGGLVSDDKNILMDSETAGDEPYMMAMSLPGVPVLVGQDRIKSGLTAVDKFKSEVILLDDGFQHRKLKRNIDLVLLDCLSPLGNRHIIPRGILREPAKGIERGGAFVLTRSDSVDTKRKNKSLTDISSLAHGKPVYLAGYKPYIFGIVKGRVLSEPAFGSDFLAGKNVSAFSGIAKNNEFRKTVDSFGTEILSFDSYPDHYQYSGDDIGNIKRRANEKGAEYVLTTEKDYVRIAQKSEWDIPLIVIGVTMFFESGEDKFISSILNTLDRD